MTGCLQAPRSAGARPRGLSGLRGGNWAENAGKWEGHAQGCSFDAGKWDQSHSVSLAVPSLVCRWPRSLPAALRPPPNRSVFCQIKDLGPKPLKCRNAPRLSKAHSQSEGGPGSPLWHPLCGDRAGRCRDNTLGVLTQRRGLVRTCRSAVAAVATGPSRLVARNRDSGRGEPHVTHGTERGGSPGSARGNPLGSKAPRPNMAPAPPFAASSPQGRRAAAGPTSPRRPLARLRPTGALIESEPCRDCRLRAGISRCSRQYPRLSRPAARPAHPAGAARCQLLRRPASRAPLAAGHAHHAAARAAAAAPIRGLPASPRGR